MLRGAVGVLGRGAVGVLGGAVDRRGCGWRPATWASQTDKILTG